MWPGHRKLQHWVVQISLPNKSQVSWIQLIGFLSEFSFWCCSCEIFHLSATNWFIKPAVIIKANTDKILMPCVPICWHFSRSSRISLGTYFPVSMLKRASLGAMAKGFTMFSMLLIKLPRSFLSFVTLWGLRLAVTSSAVLSPGPGKIM